MRGKQELQLFLWNWCGLLQIAFVQWYLWRTDHYSFEVKFCETEPNEDCSCPLVSWRPSLLEVITPTCPVSKSLFHPDVRTAQDPTNSTLMCITQHPSTQPGNVRFQRPWNAFAVWSRWWKSWAMWRVDAYGAVPGCWGAMYGSKEMCMKVVSWHDLGKLCDKLPSSFFAMANLGTSPPKPLRPRPMPVKRPGPWGLWGDNHRLERSNVKHCNVATISFWHLYLKVWAPGTIFRGVGLKGWLKGERRWLQTFGVFDVYMIYDICVLFLLLKDDRFVCKI